MFTDFRTDLALERHEILPESEMSGIISETIEEPPVKITRIKVTNEEGSKRLGKPRGTYITAEIPPLTRYCADEEKIVTVIGRELQSLLPEAGTVLTAGLGNESITPDALGKAACEMVLATRHLSGEFSQSAGLGALRASAVFPTGVLGKTGVETAEVIKGLTELLKPCAVIVIDALAARRLSRLGCTVQMSDSGIVPGSGVGNARTAINRETLGVPVISLGVPTVADALTLVNEFSENRISKINESRNMIITPREIDLVISRAARIIGLAVDKALQPHISVEEMLMLTASD